jgi:hypothetical protein
VTPTRNFFSGTSSFAGAPVDFDAACEWFRKAAAQDHAEALRVGQDDHRMIVGLRDLRLLGSGEQVGLTAAAASSSSFGHRKPPWSRVSHTQIDLSIPILQVIDMIRFFLPPLATRGRFGRGRLSQGLPSP